MVMESAATSAPRATKYKASRVGKRPIVIPKGVAVSIIGRRVDIQGPKGRLFRELAESTVIERDGETLRVSSTATECDGPRLQGLERALLANMVLGVAQGFQRILELVGTGYRCELKGQTLVFQLGFSHQKTMVLPGAISASIPPDSKGTILVLSSPDKGLLGQTLATIRSFRPPEPYGGKGIRYRGERIRKKAGKAGKGRK
jgi:large subunit ribosomal protein L6